MSIFEVKPGHVIILGWPRIQNSRINIAQAIIVIILKNRIIRRSWSLLCYSRKNGRKNILPDSVLASGLGRIFMDVKISMSETSTPLTSFDTRNAASATSSRTENPSPPQRDFHWSRFFIWFSRTYLRIKGFFWWLYQKKFDPCHKIFRHFGKNRVNLEVGNKRRRWFLKISSWILIFWLSNTVKYYFRFLAVLLKIMNFKIFWRGQNR